VPYPKLLTVEKKRIMGKITIIITQDNGETTKVEKIVKESEALESFNAIEQYTLQIRREMFPELQKKLLTEAQEGYKKKGVKE
jgi:hypothetical protein